MRRPYYRDREWSPKDEFTAGPAARPWWEPPGRDDDEAARATSLWNTVRELEDVQRAVHEQYLWNARLYANRELADFDWGHGARYAASLQPVSLLGENLVLSVVDTIHAMVGKNRVKATPVPKGASYRTHRLASKLDRFLQGEWDRESTHDKLNALLLDSLIFGYGVLKVTRSEDEDEGACHRVVMPDNFAVDQAEAAVSDGAPMHAYERRCLPVATVEAEYGLEPGSLGTGDLGGWLDHRTPGRGWCVVVEGHRRAVRAGKKKVPGRRVVAVHGRLLVDEEYLSCHLPYLVFHPVQSPGRGFYRQAVVEQVLPYQVRLNEINEVIRDAQDLCARPRLLVAEGSRVNPQDLDNLVGRIIKYTGVAPTPLEWNAVSGELYAERDHQVRACFEQFGLSQLSAQGRLPGGARLDSSAALQEATSITDDRLATLIMRWETFQLDVARATLRVMHESGRDAVTTWRGGGRGAAEEIRWSEVDMSDSAYTLTLGAASVFSLTPSARRDRLEAMRAQGLPDDVYWDMYGHPDLETIEGTRSASLRDLRRVVEDLEDGKTVVPDPLQDLVTGVEYVNRAYLRLRSQFADVPAKVLLGFVKWIALARAILAKGTQTPDNQGLGTVPATGPAPGPAVQAPAMVPAPPGAAPVAPTPLGAGAGVAPMM